MSDETRGWSREVIESEQTGNRAFIYTHPNVSVSVIKQAGSRQWYFYHIKPKPYVFKRLSDAKRAAHEHARRQP